MLEQLAKWIMTPVPWHHFWDPRSGFRGGIIMLAAIIVVGWIMGWWMY